MIGLITGLIAGFQKLGRWLLAPFLWMRSMFLLKRTNALLIAENALLREENAALKAALLALKAELAQITERLDDRKRWEEYTTVRGGVVLRSKNADDPTRPVIYACINCSRAGGETILQHDRYRAWLVCKDHGKVGSDEPDRSAENMQKMMDRLGPERGPGGRMRR
ncbi:hypothetical protein [Achromobacter sp. Marseille-Q0513]|uniref:hypothetical protein n=1 Tax=Achromobacter sp. Marseille-Q0513 TaxID=2829161 RepID=UPI001BAD45F7|nr:hypothetical protein [Achromobacter sp. Marseille-Q0513]